MILSEALSTRWSISKHFLDAGIAKDRSAPEGSLGEALVAGALSGDSAADAVHDARYMVSKSFADEAGGPAWASKPEGKVSPQIVDLAIPWTSVVKAIPAISAFASERQRVREAWDRSTGHRALARMDANPKLEALWRLARVQVKTRVEHFPLTPVNHDAVQFSKYVRFDGPSAIDLVACVLLARYDEHETDLTDSNFAWHAVLLTEPALKALDPSGPSAKLGWADIRGWFQSASMPIGCVDISPQVRRVEVAGW